MNEKIKPRQLANLMIEEFVNGGQVKVNPEAYPKEVKNIAIVHARNAAAIIVHHARIARKDPGHYARMTKDMAATIRRYNETRMVRKAA